MATVKEIKLCDSCAEDVRVGYGLTPGFRMTQKYNIYDLEKCAICGKRQRGLHMYEVKNGHDE